MNTIIKYSFFILTLSFFASCYVDEITDTEFHDEFYLRHEGADLPVWVRGNSSAETFVIFIHGGPFDTAIEEAVYGRFEPLYDDFAMVFFDQRGGGYAHGKRTVNLTEEQFVEDIEVVVKLIQDKYPQAQNLFLMGHSFGGYFGTSFLKTGDNQLNFKGWIELAGSHNLNFNWLASRDYCMNYLQDKLATEGANQQKEEWLEALENTPQVTNINELFTINGIAFQISKELNAGKNNFENPSKLFLMSAPTGTGFSQKNQPNLEDLIVYGNLNPEMGNITLPSLLIYGAEDPIVPPASGMNGIEFLGTPAADKSLVVLPNSGHSVWEYDIDEFFGAVRTFIKKYE